MSLDRALPALFFVSGAAALVFETLWFRQATLAVGSTVWASSIVLASFMAGLALGGALGGRAAARLRRPLETYAALEVAIAIAGVAVVLALPRLAGWCAPAFRALEGSGGQDALRLVLAFAVLMVPATAMGATLPLLAHVLSARDANAGVVIGRLYGWNTLGAVAGSLLAETCTIAWFGVRGSALLAAGLDAVAACAALAIARRLAAAPGPQAGDVVPAPAKASALDGAGMRLLLGAGLAGATMLALEVVWMRLVLFTVFGTSLVFALILAVVLTGIGLGGLLGAAWVRRSPDAPGHAAALAAFAGAALVPAYVALGQVPGYADAPLVLAALSTAMILPVALASGALFTLLAAELGLRTGDAGRAAGLLALGNTLGAIAGALLAGFVLLPRLGPEKALLALVVGWGLAALILASVRRSRPVLVAVAVYALAIASFPLGAWSARIHAPIDAQEVVLARDGLNETIRYTRDQAFGQPRWLRLYTNAHSMSSTSDWARRYMKLYAWLPAAVHPRVERALLISFGCGSTARALCDEPSLERLDIADTSPDIVELSKVPFPDPARDPLRDPRVRLHLEDGRFFLQTTDERWDLITSEPPPPIGAGVVNLYTREYFELIRERLREGGVCTYWLPVYSMQEPGSRAIVQAFLAAFDDASLWIGAEYDLMLVGTRGAKGPVSEEHATRLWRRPDLAGELEATGFERPEDLLATFALDAAGLRALVGDTPPLTDDRPTRIGGYPSPFDQACAEHASWLAIDRRAGFERSELIARLVPPALRARTLEVLSRPSDPRLRRGAIDVERLHALATRGGTRMAMLWELGTTVDDLRCLERAIASGARRDATTEWALAQAAISQRRWPEAAVFLGHLLEASRPRAVEAWVLCLAGDLEAARAIPRDGDPRAWEFLERTFPALRPAGG